MNSDDRRGSAPGAGANADTNPICYFAGFAAAGTSTFKMCRRICVPESSFTFSVLDTITGPGVPGLGTALRLRPLMPVTPCGIPMLSGLPVESVSSVAATLSCRGLGEFFTTTGAEVIIVDALASPPLALAATPPEFGKPEVPPRPVATGLRDPPPDMDGGSIWEG
jgi:hypothetical protein